MTSHQLSDVVFLDSIVVMLGGLHDIVTELAFRALKHVPVRKYEDLLAFRIKHKGAERPAQCGDAADAHAWAKDWRPSSPFVLRLRLGRCVARLKAALDDIGRY